MVWKIIVAIACSVLLSGAEAHAAEITEISSGDIVQVYSNAVEAYSEAVEAYSTALDVYQGTISTTYLTFFKDIVNSLGINDDYLLYRSSNDTYSMIVGDIENNGTYFEMANGYMYNISSVSGSGYGTSYYSYSVSAISDIYIDTEDYLVYSNLGNFPRLEERSVYYEFATLFIISIMLCIVLIRPLFQYVLRPRSI